MSKDKHGECENCGNWYAEDICTYDAETARYLCPDCRGHTARLEYQLGALAEAIRAHLDPEHVAHGQINWRNLLQTTEAVLEG